MSNNPFTFTAFADWIDKNRKPGQQYDYSDATVCACGQYAQSLGIEGNWINTSAFWIAANEVAGEGPSYFGDLSARLQLHIQDGHRYA